MGVAKPPYRPRPCGSVGVALPLPLPLLSGTVELLARGLGGPRPWLPHCSPGPVAHSAEVSARPWSPRVGRTAGMLTAGPAAAAGRRVGSISLLLAAFALVRWPLARAGPRLCRDPGSCSAPSLWDPLRQLLFARPLHSPAPISVPGEVLGELVLCFEAWH